MNKTLVKTVLAAAFTEGYGKLVEVDAFAKAYI